MPLPTYEFRKIEKYCLNCSEVLILKNARDINRKKFCNHSCQYKWLHKINNSLLPPRPTAETYRKIGVKTSEAMRLGLRTKPPRRTAESSRAFGLKMRGSNHPRWIKDRTKLKHAIGNCSQRLGYEITQWRKAVFSRDNYICQHCRVKGGSLEAHHILSYVNYPNLRFEIRNGFTLCKKCHKQEHNRLKSLNYAASLSG